MVLRSGCGFVFGVIIGAVALLAVLLLLAQPSKAPDIRRAPGDPDIKVFIKEDFLNAQIAAQFQRLNGPGPAGQSQFSLEDIHLNTRPGNTIEVTSNAKLGELPKVPVHITLRPYADNGRLRVDLVSSDLGRLPLPGRVGDLVNELVNRQLDRALEQAPVTVLAVSTEEDGISVELKLNPSLFQSQPAPRPTPATPGR